LAATVLVGAIAAQTPRRVALLIGNAAYETEKPLRNPVNDANAIAAVLRSELGFTDVKVLPNVRRRELVDAVARFGEAARGADAALFYFSGHGQQQGKLNYLLPVDARIDRPEHVKAEGLDADDVQAALEAASPRVSLLILDACRDNPFASRTKSTAKGLTRPRNPEEGTLIAFATRDGDVAQDGTGSNSPYAQALIASLKQADRVPIQAMFDNVSDQVKRVTENKQRPTKYGDLKVNIYLVNPSIVVNNNTLADAEQEAWEIAKRRDSVQSYQAYLDGYPYGRYVRPALVALQGLQPSPSPSPKPSPSPELQRAGQPFRDCQQAHCPEMVVIPAGRFKMGTSGEEQVKAQAAGASKSTTDRESPLREVSVRSFAAGKYAVTKGQFAAFVQASGYKTEAERGDACYVHGNGKWETQADKHWRNVGFAQGDDHPVVCVSWNDAQEYVKWLSRNTGKQYRLLSEAEREYAARGGTQTAFWWGDTISTSQANYDGNYSYNGSAKGEYRQATVPVSSFQPNAFGLYNVHGNVWEWVQDCFEDNYSKGQPIDAGAHRGNDNSCTLRVRRGGSWINVPHFLRAAYRGSDAPDVRRSLNGFRVARTVNP